MLVAVIPAYNEEKRIRKVVSETALYVDTVIVVDDGSTDDTPKQIANLDKVIALTHAINLGKGAAVRTGCDYALSIGAENIVLLDGDDQHNPKEIPRLTAHLKKNNIVFGQRKQSKSMPAFYRVGNWGLTTASKLLFGIGIGDSQCGYRAMSVKAYKLVRWQSSDYGMESEMIVRTGMAKLSYEEVFIQTIYHEKYKGTGLFDGVKILFSLLKWRMTLW